MSATAEGTKTQLQQCIREIRSRLASGDYTSEAAVSQGVVLRVLNELGWPTYDTQTVIPQYDVRGTRVDYALCHPSSKPIVFIEVKKSLDQGQRDKAQRQLFEYAFHQGVPVAVLTDGREWNFFLPSGHGNYTDRRVYKLDVSERNIEECASRLDRYLQYEAIRSGVAIDSIRRDYDDVARQREIRATLPRAWKQLVEDKDELLLDLIAEQVGRLCGYQPDANTVASFLKSTLSLPASVSSNSSFRPTPRQRAEDESASSPPPPQPSAHGFVLDGKHESARNAKQVLVKVFEALIKRDPSFAERFAALPKHGTKRRYLAQDRSSLFPERPDLMEKASQQLTNGWWLGTHFSRQSIGRVIEMACSVAQLRYGKDLRVELGHQPKTK